MTRLIAEDVFERAATTFMVAGNTTRLKLLGALVQRAMFVGELARTTRTPLSMVSKHLAVLKTAGLVEASRHGRQLRYRITRSDTESLLRFLVAHAHGF